MTRGFDRRADFGASARYGIMHYKAIVLDSRVAYPGGANVTMAARANRELVFWMCGPPVAQILEALREAMAAASSAQKWE